MTDDNLIDAPPGMVEKLQKENASLRRKLTMLYQAIPADVWATITSTRYHMTKWFNEHKELRE